MKPTHFGQASTGTLSISHRRGAALMIVLAFVVLLTVLAVAIFSRATTDRQVSYSSASQTKAELLARGALAVTIGDLKQEIAAGSTRATVSGVTIYTPKPSPSPSTLIPALVPPLVGPTPTPIPGLENLVKRSAYQKPFYANPTPAPSPIPYDTSTYPASNRAANVSTLTPSLSGRYISTARWNKPLLLQKATLISDTNISPVAAFVPPDWILIARDGSNPTAWSSNMITSANNASSVIGRYAYTIYDEGGLLDMNVAGNPTVSTVAQVGRKGAVAYADLTQIPGISSLTSTNQTKFINNIVGWRNFSSGAATGNLGTFSSGSTYNFASGTNYYNAIVLARNGFMAVSNTALNNGQSDRMFASRQELINLLVRGMASSASDRANLQVALEYFGTFSRERNGPTWSPTYNAGDINGTNGPSPQFPYAYKNNASVTASPAPINPNLMVPRVVNSFTRADGTTLATVGEPLFKTRFSLNKITALQNASTTNTLAQPYFGLYWNSGQNRWDYIGASTPPPGVVQPRILTLDEVANGKVLTAAGAYTGTSVYREPNFFEILKAVILSGSVGFGTNAATFVAAENKYWDTTNGLSSDYQIMQIGANIIDAWNPGYYINGVFNNNVPTFIGFAKDPSTSQPYELAGVKNLPYLNKLVFTFFFTNGKPNPPGDLFYAWLVPSLWNPHQNASAAPTTTTTPAGPDVRVAMTSGSMNFVIKSNNNTTTFSPSTAPITGSAYYQVQANAFQVPCPPVPSQTASPAPNETGKSNLPATMGPQTMGTGAPVTVQGAKIGTYDGFYFGTDGNGNGGYKDPTGHSWGTGNIVDHLYPVFLPDAQNNLPTFEMQVPINGAWPGKTYQRWKGCAQPASGNPLWCFGTGLSNPGYKSSSGFQDPDFITLDPRTVRFGVWGNDAGDSAIPEDYVMGTETTMDQPIVSGAPDGREMIYRLLPHFSTSYTLNAQGFAYLYAANTQGPAQYKDLDGIVRRGDATTTSDSISAGHTIMYENPYSTPIPTPIPNSQDRPLVLSSPFQSGANLGFQSVAELGQVSRDQSWKTLKFTSDNIAGFSQSLSADAGLLDAFTLQDASVVAGKTSLNTRQSAVLKAILSQTALKLNAATSSDLLTPSQIYTAGSPPTGIVPALMNLSFKPAAPQGMLMNKGELVTRLELDNSVTGLAPLNKVTHECVIRAFSDACQTRTWNLMIDVIAQSGRYPPTAGALGDFIVEGEKRYWLHVAIDRFTGEVVDQQLEAVYE
jgi:hypothetical protein